MMRGTAMGRGVLLSPVPACGTARRAERCANGHAVQGAWRFCAACGSRKNRPFPPRSRLISGRAWSAMSCSCRTYELVDARDEASCRSDFAVLCYSGYLKDRDREELAAGLSVPPGTPPVFLAHGDDAISDPRHSVFAYLALRRAGVPAELHLYAKATHDFGVRPGDRPCLAWT